MRLKRKINHRGLSVPVICLLLLLAGCKSFKEQNDELPDNSYKGTINVSADETFKPGYIETNRRIVLKAVPLNKS